MDIEACNKPNRTVTLARNTPEYVAGLHEKHKMAKATLAQAKGQLKTPTSGKIPNDDSTATISNGAAFIAKEQEIAASKSCISELNKSIKVHREDRN